MDEIYIASHIFKIENLYQDYPSKIQDSLWRIASNANLFWDGKNDNLDPSGVLSDEQIPIVWEFIMQFNVLN